MKILKVNQLTEARGYPGLSKNFRKQGSYKVTASKDGGLITFEGNTVGDVYTSIIDWLFKNDYTFDGSTHNVKVRKVFTSSEIESESSYGFNDFYEFSDDKYLMFRKINTGQMMSNIKLMFDNFDVDDIKFIGFNEEPTEIETEIEKVTQKMTFIEAAQVILKQNNNEPMSAVDIWSKISDENLVDTKGKTPKGTLLKLMSIHSNNTPVKDRRNSKDIFTITQTSPIKFKLINSNIIQDAEDNLEDVEIEDTDIIKFGPFSGIPTDYKAVQSQDEKEVLDPAERNPFGGESKEAGDEFNSSALFVVGLSGSGKSTRILSLLRKNGHRIILIGAENAPSPNLLFEYDQNEGYVPSDIGEFIISAKNDPTHFYTIVFDECHEYIDEIKRSILHAISTKRGEKRFFGVRKSVRNFFEDLDTYESTSKVIPDNVGFIFISSKPDVFEYHADFMGRVDKVEVKREDPYPYPDLKYIQSKIDRQDQL